MNNFLNYQARKAQGSGKLLAIFFAMIMAMLPAMSFASGGEDVTLQFSQTDHVYLGISLVFAIISILAGLYYRAKVTAVSPGDEKMQEVGAAIRAGALAYLNTQGRTIAIFVGLLSVVLFAMYQSKYGAAVGGGIVLTFILGVAASYFAGYLGMDMAVKANMRTAAAALTSYKKSLEVAFQAGAVAGLITVGLGLLGATIVFLAAPENAMKLLVGFGFGGSLAALFMRVGGGIYTKAADVGADLVGKVEAGIPEDDPRNPAVIADNVGDNVGDCAGMAADVFESYEVTLVAAIVLGAATAAILPTDQWMRLVMFALMARGVGIIASIIGIAMVKGPSDINADPLKPIQSGFRVSAAIAAVLTAGLAWYMMGGLGGSSSSTGIIKTSELVPFEKYGQEEQLKIKKIQYDVYDEWVAAKRATIDVIADLGAKRSDKDSSKLTIDEIMKDPRMDTAYKNVGFKAATKPEEGFTKDEFKLTVVQPLVGQKYVKGEPIKDKKDEVPAAFVQEANAAQAIKTASKLDEMTFGGIIQQGVSINPKQGLPPLRKLEGYQVVDPNSKEMEKFSVDLPPTDQMSQPATLSIKEAFGSTKIEDQYIVYVLNVESSSPQGGSQKQTAYYGPVKKSVADKLIADAIAQQGANLKVTKEAIFPTVLMKNKDNEFALGVLTKSIADKSVRLKDVVLDSPQRIQGGQPMSFYDMSKVEVEKAKKDGKPLRPTVSQTGVAKQTVAEWWKFFLCIFIGIAMAFVFELMTDYYVSTHKRPTREVAGVASAGPAPMIISGFALGLESSVFSVLAICVSLVAPLLLFPGDVYGGLVLSFYGIALVGLGLLTTTGFILAMDTFGPISDNAQGVFEMSGAGHSNPEAALAVQRLDAAGNTTKALTKGFAIATAVVAAVALFHSYIEAAKLTTVGMPLEAPEIFVGLLIGGAAPFLFSAFLINAVGRASFNLIGEVRRQFRNDSGIMAGTSKPDYGRCVAIVTQAAQKELLSPGILAVALPLFVVFTLAIGKATTNVGGQEYNLVGAQALGGFLAGTILSGQLLAVLLANSGGIWDNAKKLIEDGMHGGKGTEAHKAGVVCDTVGDPFKDTAGPALNPLIKVMNLVALLMAPYVIFPGNDQARTIGAAVSLGLLAFAFYVSKKGSIASEMEAMTKE